MKVHVCALDRHCWKMWWQIAAPMRVHVGSRYWDIPVLTAIANWRTPRIWDLENAVRRSGGGEEPVVSPTLADAADRRPGIVTKRDGGTGRTAEADGA